MPEDQTEDLDVSDPMALMENAILDGTEKRCVPCNSYVGVQDINGVLTCDRCKRLQDIRVSEDSGIFIHSKAPWNHQRRSHVHAILDADGKELCFIGFPYEHNGEPCGSIVSQGRSEDEVAATALLMTRAPDLLRENIELKLKLKQMGIGYGQMKRKLNARRR